MSKVVFGSIPHRRCKLACVAWVVPSRRGASKVHVKRVWYTIWGDFGGSLCQFPITTSSVYQVGFRVDF